MSEDFGRHALDDAIRTRLATAAPPTGDAEAVLRTLNTRFRHARRRHRIVVGAASALVMSSAIVIGVLALRSGPAARSVHVAPANSSTPAVPAPSTPTSSPTTGAPGQQTATPSTSRPASSGTTNPTSVSLPDDRPSVTATSSPSPAPPVRTYASAGGSVTVRLEAGALSLVSSTPAPGFTEERHDTGPDRVEVRFSSGGTEWRIRVDVVNGELIEETTPHG